jgi:hypothetical protein
MPFVPRRPVDSKSLLRDKICRRIRQQLLPVVRHTGCQRAYTRGCRGRARSRTSDCAKCDSARAKGQFATPKRSCQIGLGGPSSPPAWLTEEVYFGDIQPLLAGFTNKVVASALGVSISYASAVRAGRRVPHPRHWQTLAGLANFSSEVQ